MREFYEKMLEKGQKEEAEEKKEGKVFFWKGVGKVLEK